MGFRPHSIVAGALTAERFDEGILKELIPCLRPNQVVVLDNLCAHHFPVAREAIARAGCYYLHLPPYSPGFNPMERAWSKMKTVLRGMPLRAVGPLGARMVFELKSISAENAMAKIRHCGWKFRAQVMGSPL